MIGENNATFAMLAPYTNYTFYVIAYGPKGGSDHSEMVTVQTKEDGQWSSKFLSACCLLSAHSIILCTGNKLAELAHYIDMGIATAEN